MKSLLNPNLFSIEFKITPRDLNAAGLIDPILNCDTRLFIDPLLLSTSKNKKIRSNGTSLLKKRFQEIISLVEASDSIGDLSWRSAAKKLALDERPETCLGYGGSGTSGSSRPDEIKQKVLLTTKEAVKLGEKNPKLLSLVGLFEEGIGPDTISDLTTNIILPVLCEITEEFCKTHKIPTIHFDKYYQAKLPENPYKKRTPVILVPQDIVRELPLAADWRDVSRVVSEIKDIRDSFNNFVGLIAEATITERKEALRQAAFKSLENFRALMNAMLNSSNHYDPNIDTLNFYAFRKILRSNPKAFQRKVTKPKTQNIEELKRVTLEIINHFREMVENNNLWEMLWDHIRPKRERAAQLLFFAVADAFCKANDIDISPETNMGGGPVDFKFSNGHSKRVVVEIKLSKGQVVHGYEKQLEIYKKASKAEGILLVVDVGGLGKKLAKITKVREQRLSRSEKASDIEYIDAKRRLSASKA